MTATVLEARGLVHAFGSRQVLRGVDLSLSRGECVGLLGLNGAGKSTTLAILAGVLAPTAGEVLVDGIRLAQTPSRAKAHLGYLPDVPPLFDDLPVADYLLLAARRHALPSPHDAVARVLDACQLDDVATRPLRDLSKGYQQRVGLAQAIVHAPAVVLLDEPTSGLDPKQLHGMRALIRALTATSAVLLSTHLLAEVQASCDRVAMLHDGVLQALPAHDPALEPMSLALAANGVPT